MIFQSMYCKKNLYIEFHESEKLQMTFTFKRFTILLLKQKPFNSGLVPSLQEVIQLVIKLIFDR